MPYLIWLTYLAALFLLDQLGINEFLHEYFVTLLMSVVSLIGFVLVIWAYSFLVEKLGEDRGWRSGLSLGLVLGPLLFFI